MNEANPKRLVDAPKSETDEQSGKTSLISAASETNQRAVDIQAYIGARLRSSYDDVASQPVPDRFLQLMQQLDKA